MSSEESVGSFDREAFLSNLEGMEDIALIAIESFTEKLPELTSSLSEAIERSDPAAVRLAAHTLKGVVSNFQAERSRVLAWELEKMGASGVLSEAAAALPKLLDELSILARDLNVLAEEMKTE